MTGKGEGGSTNAALFIQLGHNGRFLSHITFLKPLPHKSARAYSMSGTALISFVVGEQKET